MTDTEKIIAVLRDHGAANVWFDDSATDGQCWQVETRDDWYQSVAEAVLEALNGREVLPADEHHFDTACDDRPYCEIREHHALEDM